MSLQFNLKKADEGTAPKIKSALAKNQLFSMDDEDEAPVFIPKGAKISKNVGPAINQSLAAWDASGIKHPLQRPMDKYFSDKAELAKKMEQEQLKEKQKEKTLEENKMAEWQKIKEMIRTEKNKVRICLLCKRKFISAAQLSKHEKSSKIHSSNLMTFSKKIKK